MQVFHSLSELPDSLSQCAVAIGNFDGCHLGHAKLIDDLKKEATRKKIVPAVLTFHPHPVEVLNPNKTLENLSTSSEKLSLLEEQGVEVVLVVKFDRMVAQLSPDEFFRDFLQTGLKAKSIHVGFNFSFGKNRVGNTDYLKKLCDASGVGLRVLPAFELDGERVSSSLIRKLVGQGSVQVAKKLLGRPYTISGPVVRGDQRGRRLGFRTANVQYTGGKVLPQLGVYVTETRWQRQTFRSVTNVGVKPTFAKGQSPVVIETHLLDFQSSLYDEPVEVAFLDRIREERKFGSVDELKMAIEHDIGVAQAYFSK